MVIQLTCLIYIGAPSSASILLHSRRPRLVLCTQLRSRPFSAMKTPVGPNYGYLLISFAIDMVYVTSLLPLTSIFIDNICDKILWYLIGKSLVYTLRFNVHFDWVEQVLVLLYFRRFGRRDTLSRASVTVSILVYEMASTSTTFVWRYICSLFSTVQVCAFSKWIYESLIDHFHDLENRDNLPPYVFKKKAFIPTW